MQKGTDWLVNAFLLSMIGLAKLMPYRARVRFFGFIAGYVVGPLAGFISKGVRNLHYAFPEMPEAEARRIARQVAVNSGRNLIENYSKAELARQIDGMEITGPGLAQFEAARATGRPVLLVSGHFGNYEVVRVALHNRGHQIGALYRPARNPYFDRHYRQTMEDLTGPAFAQDRRGILGFSRYLKEGGIVAMLFDVRATRYGDVEFLGHPAPTSTFFAELALKSDALLVPFFARRDADGLSHSLSFEAPIPLTTPDEMTREMSRRLEAQVRAAPEQWLWLHDRWGSEALRERRATERQGDETRHP